MPFLTRRTESFGVTIPEEIYHHALLKEIRKSYVLQTSILAVVVLVVYFILSNSFGAEENFLAMLFFGALVLYVVGTFAIYLAKHFQMKGLKEEHKWHQSKPQRVVIDTKFRHML